MTVILHASFPYFLWVQARHLALLLHSYMRVNVSHNQYISNVLSRPQFWELLWHIKEYSIHDNLYKILSRRYKVFSKLSGALKLTHS